MMSMEQTLSRLRTRQFFAVAGQTFLIHDYFLTFPLEVDYIWHGRWQPVKIIFLLNRYGNLIGQSLFTLEELGILSHRSEEFCGRFPWFIAIFGLLSQESIHILVLLRAWAIWGGKYYVAVALISAYMLYLSASIGLLIYVMAITSNHLKVFRFIYLEETGVCISPGVSGGPQWILPLISLSLDFIVSVMVASSLGKIFKQTQGFQRSPVFRVLSMDAALFFVTNAITGTTAILCQTVFVHDPRSILVIACIPLLTVTGQRVVLNLRRLTPRPQTEHVVNRNVVGRQISARRPSLVWQSAEHRMTNHHQEPQQDRESGEVDTASALELLVMGES